MQEIHQVKRLIIMVALAAFGCEAKIENGGWWCWNPGSLEHATRCSDACLDPGNPRVYCYCEVNCYLPPEGSRDE